MCTDEQHKEKMDALRRVEKLLVSRVPIDDTVMISDIQGWVLDYRDRRHVFIWLPTALTFNLGEYGTGPVPAQVWVNLGIQAGFKIFTVGQPTPTAVKIRYTDEVIP